MTFRLNKFWTEQKTIMGLLNPYLRQRIAVSLLLGVETAKYSFMMFGKVSPNLWAISCLPRRSFREAVEEVLFSSPALNFKSLKSLD